MKKNLAKKMATFVAVCGALFYWATPVEACTRVLYTGIDGLVITGRTMDWKEDIGTNLYIFPRGISRKGGVTSASVSWSSKYGSIIASAYESGSADGMNEKGLVVNLLSLAESEYQLPNDKRPVLAVSLWPQYVLDNFATVQEAMAVLEDDAFQIVAPELPNVAKAKLHLSISDPTGDSAVLEYKNGKLMIYHGPEYKVMTNSPFYDDQLAINRYWNSVGAIQMLPGTNRASDRFARASFYIDAIPKTASEQKGVAAVFSVIRNTSVPFGITTEGHPNIATTIWRTVSDQKNLKYFYESTLSPNVFWVDLTLVDFSAGSGIRKLPLANGEIYAGNTSDKFVKDAGFTFMITK
ncbi:MAG: linear amide C-N hydrolase [Phocaeicola sp.]